MPRWATAALVALVIGVPVVLGAVVALQSVYFVGTNASGQVTLYRGLPYDLPAGIRLYNTQFQSGVPASAIEPRRRDKLLDHKLRSHGDAVDLIRQLELGKLS